MNCLIFCLQATFLAFKHLHPAHRLGAHFKFSPYRRNMPAKTSSSSMSKLWEVQRKYHMPTTTKYQQEFMSIRKLHLEQLCCFFHPSCCARKYLRWNRSLYRLDPLRWKRRHRRYCCYLLLAPFGYWKC